jgi:histidinol dehydrogenase
VHEAGRPSGWCVESEPGVMISRRPDPIARVGIYAPGGRAAYHTSLLMAAIPASVAGVSEIVVCSPPEASGLPDDNVLAAAALAGVDEVWSIGGAQAVAAMAFGTESLKAVDCIVGPGNSWVTEAKLQVNGIVGIDTPAGPSEVLVLAGPGADPCRVAAEMLAQCEHDPRACAVAVCLDEAVA